ncbi:MAG: Bifunctional NAD(P)H-hydrate repair enzyme Nnr [Chloroflexi bacterium ADurb.Bin325]|nr:MAG: Bifunctional NAD(P)H-hydrate repair enzyme Nnr [Chloroflexi bacterium ADurb.Bin325]
MKLVDTATMRDLEQATDAHGHSYAAMMALAGQAVAGIAMITRLIEPDEHVLVLVGPGNNGGDGLVAARALLDAGLDITVYVWKRDIKGDENFRMLKRRRRKIAILWADNDPDFAKLREELGRAELVIDALLGTGVTRPIEAPLSELLAMVKEVIAARRRAAKGLPPTGLLAAPHFPLLDAQTFGIPLPRPSRPFMAGDDEFDDFDEEEFGDLDWDEPWSDGEAPWPELPVLAVDCPSGLNCDTGQLDPAALEATATVTFGLPKWGQLQHPGAAACGLLGVVDIGIPPELVETLPVELIEPDYMRRWLPQRLPDAHKGTFGKALIAGGSLNYTGAVGLSARAATRAGAGLVTLAIPLSLHAALVGWLPEATWLPLPGAEGHHTAEGAASLLARADDYSALLVGPGLTTDDGPRAFVDRLFAADGLDRDAWAGRVVVDADALNLLAQTADWPARLPYGAILTPHPGEMGRLAGLTASEVNARRIENARRYAAAWGHIVLLKGPHTVIAAPDGRTAVLPFATAALATAGSGDVLAGAIVAMLAQGLPAFEAAVVGAYLHGHAGLLAERSTGPAGTVAGDLPVRFPEALGQFLSGR